MKENFLNYLLCNILLFFVGVISVYAYYPTVSSSGDLINASYTSSGRFYINNSNDFSASSYFQSTEWGGYYDSSTNKKAMVSVKNGTYYVWHKGLDSSTTSSPYKVNVTNSCDNQLKKNQTGSFTMERCFIKTSSSTTMEESLGTVSLCASGYKATGGNVVTDTCSSMSLNGLSKRYCKKIYSFTCVKGSGSTGSEPVVEAATLSNLSISAGTLSPAFKSSTKSYSATVASNVSSIKVSATAASGGSLVSGYGSRTVKLAYGKNSIKVKVANSAGAITTYTISVTRKDDRSGVNTLSNLTISTGTLSPAFSSDKTNYSVSLGNEITSLTINATLTDSKSKFASGFGPRSVSLKEGTNQIYIKVISQKGVTKTYTITANRGKVSSSCSLKDGELALLKGIVIEANEQTQISIEDFDPLKKDYDGISVPYEVRNLTISPLVQDEGDTYEIGTADDLQVNKPTEITITVTSKACPSYRTVYTLIVTRQDEVLPNSTADLKDIKIKNHDEFKFEKNRLDYGLTLKKNEKKLDITYVPESETTKCSIEGNSELKYNKVIEIKCTSEDGVDNVVYTITIDGVSKGISTFWIILIIILLIIALVLLGMRLLGYRVYFNKEAVKAMFRGIGEKAKDTFDK